MIDDGSQITGLSKQFVGDMEGTSCRLEFLAMRPDPERFGWSCMCHAYSWDAKNYEDALIDMRSHIAVCELQDE